MPQSNDLSRSFTALNQDNTLIVVIEMSQSSWLVAGMVPGVERQPLKKLEPGKDQLLKLLNRWRQEALRAGHAIERVVVAYEAGRDGFWLARWLRERGVEAYVMHPSSVAVSREHRRAKTDRLDTELLMRAFLGWLRGERRHCSMAAIPTIEEEDAKRPNREHEKLVGDRTRIVNRMKSTLARLGIRWFKPTLAGPKKSSANCALQKERFCLRIRVRSLVATWHGFVSCASSSKKSNNSGCASSRRRLPQRRDPIAMIHLIARVMGIGIETADMLVNEILSRHLRDSKAVARYAGLTGSPDESGKRRREKGLARAGNARVRRGMIQLAWRFLRFQKDSELAQWFRARAADGRRGTRKTMIVALARKLLIALWRMATTGEIPEGMILRPAA